MKVLAIDPGALRQGYACITKGNNGRFTLLFSGYDGLVRGDDEAYQAYRMRLVNYWVENFRSILHQANVRGEKCTPYIVSEILPAVGGGNFAAATQDQLAKAVITTCQTLAIEDGYVWNEISANTVKKNVTGLKPKQATKIQVRNATINVFPQLLPRKKEIMADESDAIAIGLASLGYKYGTTTQNLKGNP